MKKIYKTGFFGLSLLLLSALFRPAGAFFMPQLHIDPYPMPDFVDQALATGKSAINLGQTAQKTINTTENTLNNAKTAVQAAFSGNVTTLLNVGGSNPGQKQIVDCNYLGQKFKMTNSDDVAEIARLLFLQYPVNPRKDAAGAQKYDQYRRDFYRDSMMEIYTAAIAMENELDTVLKPSVDETILCIKGESSNCGIPAPDGNNDSAFVEGKALEATANVYEMLLKVTALKAQLAAVKVIGNSTPAKYVEGVKEEAITSEETSEDKEEQQQSSRLLEQGEVYASARVLSTQRVAFAQLVSEAEVSVQAQPAQKTAATEKVSVAQQPAVAATSLTEIEAQSRFSGNAAQQVVTDTLSFVLAPEDTSTHPYTDAADKMAELDKIAPLSEQVDQAVEVHNLMVRLPEYKNAAEAVNEVKENYERALAALRTSNQCALDYLGRRYTDPEIAWAGGRLGENINNADIRKGISGWALEAYETAKAAQVTEDATENVASLDIDTDTTKISDITATDENNKILQNAGAENISSSKKEQGAKEARETRMLSWQIGSEAAHLLSDEPKKWGKPARREAVWTDVKTFYNQYLQFKYDNIRSYLKSYSKNDVLAVVAERLQGKEAAIEDNKKQQAVRQANQELSAQLEASAADQERALKQQNAGHETRLTSLQNRRQEILQQMDKADARQKELSDKLADLRNKAQEDAANSMQAVVTHKTTFPTDGSYTVTDEGTEASYQVADEEEDTATFNAATAQNKENSEIDSVKKELDKVEQELSGLERKLDSADKEIVAYRLSAPTEVSSLLAKIKEQKIQKSDTILDKISKLDTAYSKDVKQALLAILSKQPETNPLLSPAIIYGNVERAAGLALDELYAKVDARIELAQKQLAALDEDLYDAASHDKVVAIHQSMINDIKAMSLTVAAAGIQTIDNIRLYAKLEQADTSAEEEAYFVGSTGKERDLKAPKAIFEINLPPLREAVHFDEVDWQNVIPYSEGVTKSGTIMKADFLNYGGKIPEIWKYMLKDNAFEERSLDLKAALNQGCEAVALYRGGVMPCRVKDSAIILDVNADAEYVKGQNAENLGICPGIEMKSGKPYLTMREVGITLPLFGSQKSEKSDCPYSELGTLLDADENGNLYFRQAAYDAFYGIVYEQNHPDKEFSGKENQRMSVYDQTPLNRNQTDDFLQYFENEQTQRKNLEETQQDYEAMIQEFFDVLSSYGFTPSEDFDFADEGDYNLAREKLENIKNDNISQVLSEIEEVDIIDNAVVEERVNVLKSMIAALQKDSEETTIISAGVDDDNHLDEDIKSSKVNEEVTDKFIDSLDKQSEKAIRVLAPYCPNY